MFQNLLDVLQNYESINIVFTKSNADNDGSRINQMIDEFVLKYPENVVVHTSLGQLRYLSTLKYVSGVVGNSSSGIIEAPSIGIPSLNIGSRQDGRVFPKSVINCNANKKLLNSLLKKLIIN